MPRAGARARRAGPRGRGGFGRRRAGPRRASPRRVRAPGGSRSRHATPPHGQPPAQRRAVRSDQGAQDSPDDPGHDRPDRTLHRRAGGLHRGRDSAQRGAGLVWRQGMGLVGVSRLVDSQDRSSERRPGGQQPKLDLPDAGQGNGHDRMAPGRDHRPRGLGPRS